MNGTTNELAAKLGPVAGVRKDDPRLPREKSVKGAWP
jgi:hypothetical protein